MKLYLILFLPLFIALPGWSQTETTRTKHFNLKKQIALDGYDPVSYFDHQPTEGKSELK
jgi:hypothetical protein